ncbi:trans-aconitate 2-methyltransferase [Acuticoccus sp. I52.16.1]|uniref:class I SAM-dependent methyltransferase n=1 Tax=Acuticoccus sp. I52.16.1 TaxID=2928472 RepID=UPI001FD38E03|nr:class I SAM-dependent methyltransferase [Acuticoccus sp. I52.16.1]UOM34975.1 class I SAM-dependent methyltransferase [Acuticoccus sp. I52.16.1]
MPDPFSDPAAADDALVAIMIDTLEARGVDPAMVPIVDAYLELLAAHAPRRIVEIGAGTGAVARRIAARFPQAEVHGVDPSPQFIAVAESQPGPNLSFAVGDGRSLAEPDGSADVALLHTVLTHVPDPAPLVAEAVRILRPGGALVVCDADFSKLTMAAFEGDPLGACSRVFVENYVTDPYLVAKLPALAAAAGLTVAHFSLANRLDRGHGAGVGQLRMANSVMVAQGLIGQPFADALVAEYERRSDAGTMYGFMPFATLVATKDG